MRLTVSEVAFKFFLCLVKVGDIQAGYKRNKIRSIYCEDLCRLPGRYLSFSEKFDNDHFFDLFGKIFLSLGNDGQDVRIKFYCKSFRGHRLSPFFKKNIINHSESQMSRHNLQQAFASNDLNKKGIHKKFYNMNNRGN